MAKVEHLIAMGLPAEIAKRTGFDLLAKTTDAATQNSAGGLLRGPGNKMVYATVAGANGAITLPSDAELNDIIVVYNVTATAGRVFPHVGGTISQLTANTQAVLPANAAMVCVKQTAAAWRAGTLAAVA